MVALSYLILDVFTDQALTGNPLAVVPYPQRELSDQQMQTIAGEFNLSETVFIYPPKDNANTAQLRIFTPTQELPFAGHPTIGAAIALGLLEQRNLMSSDRRSSIIFEEKVGPIEVEIKLHSESLGHATLRTARLPEQGLSLASRLQLAEALSLAADDLVWDEVWQPAAYSCGVPFLFIPLSSRALVDEARINTGAWESFLKNSWASSVFVFCLDAVDPNHQVYGRMFGPEKGIVEDPAAGSAAAAFAGYLFAKEQHLPSRKQWLVEQGYAMGRPSLLEITIHSERGELQAVYVGGQAVLVGEGHLLNLPF
jgi:trans-2,3-dihydro-3-hydroxyanthranilate isomerase